MSRSFLYRTGRRCCKRDVETIKRTSYRRNFLKHNHNLIFTWGVSWLYLADQSWWGQGMGCSGVVKHENPCFLSQIFDKWFYKGELTDAKCARSVKGSECDLGTMAATLLFNLMLLHQPQAVCKLDKQKKRCDEGHKVNFDVVGCRRD